MPTKGGGRRERSRGRRDGAAPLARVITSEIERRFGRARREFSPRALQEKLAEILEIEREALRRYDEAIERFKQREDLLDHLKRARDEMARRAKAVAGLARELGGDPEPARCRAPRPALPVPATGDHAVLEDLATFEHRDRARWQWLGAISGLIADEDVAGRIRRVVDVVNPPAHDDVSWARLHAQLLAIEAFFIHASGSRRAGADAQAAPRERTG